MTADATADHRGRPAMTAATTAHHRWAAAA
jgi:hypothetical protein